MNGKGGASAAVICLPEESVRRVRAENASLIAALDLVEDAIALLDSSGWVVHANCAAHRLFGTVGALCLAPDGRLQIADRQAADALRGALSSAGGAALPMRTIVAKRDGLPLILSLHTLQVRPPPPDAVAAVLIVRDPESRPGGQAATLKLIYGLTAGEVKLMQALNEGLSLKEFADWSGLSYETVRSYLKRLMSKTGAHSQTDLVRLTRSLG